MSSKAIGMHIGKVNSQKKKLKLNRLKLDMKKFEYCEILPYLQTTLRYKNGNMANIFQRWGGIVRKVEMLITLLAGMSSSRSDKVTHSVRSSVRS